MSFGAALLRAVLEEHLPSGATGLAVGVSGGADSACLLAAIAQLGTPCPIRGLNVRAVHIDHGLQPAAAALRDGRRGALPADAHPARRHFRRGRARAAVRRSRRRRARRAIARSRSRSRPGECLLTAHHAQDQAETLLLQLLRGAGLKGLSSMPLCRPLGPGWHLRPLLNVAQRDVRTFGRAQGIAAVEDPMNRDLRFDRAYLRAQVWPLLEKRWPGAGTALSRTAHHVAEAQELLDASAAPTVQRLRDGDALAVSGLRALTNLERINAVRHWLFAAEVTPPPAARLTEALRQVFAADADHLPAIVWGEHALRRYQDRLFLTPAQLPAVGEPLEWKIAPGSILNLGPGLGRLRWISQIGGLDAGRLPPALSVRQRRGGEVLKPSRRAKTQTVQHLCQSHGVLPWMRGALPMLFAGEALIAVGDLWQDARWCVAPGEPGVGCAWDDAPGLT